jgi:hypothetical protein
MGKASFSGRLPAPNRDSSDGPLATLEGARDAIRKFKNAGQFSRPINVYLRGGRYFLKQPVVFDPNDSAPVTYCSYPGEEAILDGSRPITGWTKCRTGRTALWVVELPEVKAGNWYFRELFVNGHRRPRARLPKSGTHRMAAIPEQYNRYEMYAGPVSNVFVAQPGHIGNWRNLQDVEVVVLHYWVEDRSTISNFDLGTNTVYLSKFPTHPLRDDRGNPLGRYYLENIFEALSEPGEWYLDRQSGRLHYIPMPGEDPGATPVFAPVLNQLIILAGDPQNNRFVEFIRFENLRFEHTDWYQPEFHTNRFGHPELSLTGALQSAVHLNGVIHLTGARHCAIQDCAINRIGWYGIDLADGCSGIHVVGNEIADMGAGGIKMNGADATGPRQKRTANNLITDNHIFHGGRVFHCACGIISMHSFGNTISHNHVHDLFYTGISCGWVWGYDENVSRDNIIEQNHIHHIGQGMLSDMGGIYTLGVQPGTVIRGNLIHDIDKVNYGAWCIYLDEGSSHLLIENNICYNSNAHAFCQHCGRENLVRNNIFAFADEGLIRLGRADQGRNSFTFYLNVLVSSGVPIFNEGYAVKLESIPFRSDLNLFYDVTGRLVMGANARQNEKSARARAFNRTQWQRLGQDLHSVIAEPGFRNVNRRDFMLTKNSPAIKLGFRPIDPGKVGPRKNKAEREPA